MAWQVFEGNHYQVGYQLGQYWGKQLSHWQTTNYGRVFLQHRSSKYLQWINDGWTEEYLPLFRNTGFAFPYIIEELAGMSDGLCSSGYRIKITDLFSLMLAETDVPRCSTVGIRSEDGFILAHNDEESIKYPLCVASVVLQTSIGIKRFISISYPFQLLGSCFGMNEHFAFQGNSVGCSKQINAIFKSWHDRIPKTAFTREMLELNSLDAVKTMYSSYHSTLPNNQYLLTEHGFWKAQIKPIVDTNQGCPSGQLSFSKIKEYPAVHGNHFLSDMKIDGQWIWGNNYDKESELRRHRLEQLISTRQPKTAAEAMKVMLEHRQWYPQRTSATLVCEFGKNIRKLKTQAFFQPTVKHYTLEGKIR